MQIRHPNVHAFFHVVPSKNAHHSEKPIRFSVWRQFQQNILMERCLFSSQKPQKLGFQTIIPKEKIQDWEIPYQFLTDVSWKVKPLGIGMGACIVKQLFLHHKILSPVLLLELRVLCNLYGSSENYLLLWMCSGTNFLNLLGPNMPSLYSLCFLGKDKEWRPEMFSLFAPHTYWKKRHVLVPTPIPSAGHMPRRLHLTRSVISKFCALAKPWRDRECAKHWRTVAKSVLHAPGTQSP